MAQSLKTLFKSIELVKRHGEMDVTVERLVTDSRRVVPGAVFFAIPGISTDGNEYIDEAIARGAQAIVSEEPYSVSYGSVSYLQVADAREALATAGASFYDHPDHQLQIVGITGTNGKTTVSRLVQYLLEEAQGDTGLIGTIQYDLGQRTLPAYKTTPESVDIYSILSQMHQYGCSKCVMEVSSHALDQKRVYQLAVNTAVFLNLSQDHMDYHGNMENYYACKRRLFNGETGYAPSNACVINIDDAYGRRLNDELKPQRDTITFGIESEDAQIRAREVRLQQMGSAFDVHWPGGSAHIRTRLPGYYNVSNVLAALAVAYSHGMNLEQIAPNISSFHGVPGRMEQVDAGQPYQVLVDYAHTDNALTHALNMLRPITPGRLFVVFGCGGDRDRTKRPKMVEAVLKYADRAWATADNPRKEPLENIFEDMRAATSADTPITFEWDRRSAIGEAISRAKEGDTVLIAGKGHETFQEFADRVVPFDDRQIAREWLELENQQASFTHA